jgi:hypothetical protein
VSKADTSSCQEVRAPIHTNDAFLHRGEVPKDTVSVSLQLGVINAFLAKVWVYRRHERQAVRDDLEQGGDAHTPIVDQASIPVVQEPGLAALNPFKTPRVVVAL